VSAAIELAGVEVRYPGAAAPALTGLDLAIPPGGRVAVVGPDGAGKTTLMRLIAGLVGAAAGRVRVLGRDPLRERARLSGRIGHMPQGAGVYDELTVAENLDLAADLLGLDGAARREAVERVLAATGLGPFRTRRAGRLSGGMRQKLGVGMRLLAIPPVLLLDEPGVGVDPLSRREIAALVEGQVRPETAVLWSTAYLDEAERFPRVLMLHGGRLLADGAPAELAAALRGRVFCVVPAPGRLQALSRTLAGLREVVDVAVRGGALRVVTAADGMRGALASVEGVSAVEAVSPRLEDAVAALLHASGGSSFGVDPLDPDDLPEVRGTPGEEVVVVRDLVRDFGAFRAVDHISLSVRRGEVFGLLGPNGAGKSTIFRIMCGLLPPTSGTARVLGIDLRRAAPEARARIGYMAQKFTLYGDLTVRQNLLFFAAAYGLGPIERRRRVRALIRRFGLVEVAERRARDLSLGHERRLAMAAALVHRPEILFLDEPTSGVDLPGRRAFWQRIGELAERGVTVVVTTHFLDEAEYCDRVAIVDRGRLLATGAPAGIIERARALDPGVVTLEDAFGALLRARREPEPGRAA